MPLSAKQESTLCHSQQLAEMTRLGPLGQGHLSTQQQHFAAARHATTNQAVSAQQLPQPASCSSQLASGAALHLLACGLGHKHACPGAS